VPAILKKIPAAFGKQRSTFTRDAAVGDLEMIFSIAAADKKGRMSDRHGGARAVRRDELEDSFADGWGIGHEILRSRNCTIGLGCRGLELSDSG
jgi:hypothetical protein